MPDRETVMSWLEGLAQDDWRQYHSDSEVQEIAKDALALLREQDETRLVHHYSRPGVYADLWLYCEKCGGKTDDNHKPKFCPNCGRAVKWDE